jgi:hypothetical protein
VKVQDLPPFAVNPAAAAPLPVQKLAYSHPSRRGRPGLVTAIGVISIVVASLGILFSLQTGSQVVLFYFLSRFVPPPPATATTYTTSSSGSVTVSTSVTAGPGSASATVAPATAPSAALTPAEAQTVISKVQANLGVKTLNAAQVAALTAALQNRSQQLVLPGTAWSPVKSSYLESNGTADIKLSGGSITIDAKGVVVSQYSNAAALSSFPRIGVGPMVLGLFDAVGSLLLAVMLLVAGIGALRHSRGSLRLHQFYGWAKIPVAILGGIAYGWMMSQMLTSLPGFGASNGKAIFAMYAVFMAALGCAYPIGLLITLRTRTVRGYYNSIVE